ncbi:16S rRNA (guanine(527)-N(7))-methyltransferase RsmG [Candidatus Karelsulcia muelleri]
MPENFIKQKFSHIKKKQIDQLRELSNIYKYWQNKINIISKKSINDFFINHLLSSLSIAQIVNFRKNTLILDVGTGGGFPGIPLAILFDHCKLTLIDSVSKKVKIIKDFIKYLELCNVEVKCTNVKQIKTKFNFIVTRGINTNLVNSLRKKNIIINGIFCLTGKNTKLKNPKIESKFREYKLSKIFQCSFFLKKKIIFLFNK